MNECGLIDPTIGFSLRVIEDSMQPQFDLQ
jgi:hypothetical protein